MTDRPSAPQPVAWRQPNWGHGPDEYVYYDADDDPMSNAQPLYDQAALDAAVAAAVAQERERWAERDDIHTESSRIYARLAGAVRAGADDASLARMLRHEVLSRSKSSTRAATPQEPT
jgi:hypothetical protein